MFEGLSLYVALLALVHVLGIWAAIDSIMHTRTPQGSIAWLVVLLFAPIVGLPFYLILGRSRFMGYVEARRANTEEHPRVRQLTNILISQLSSFQEDLSQGSGARVALRECLSNLVNLPFTRGNNAQLLIDGRATFSALFAAIDKATDFVLVEFFIIKNDTLGDEFQKLLIKKAKQGVKVYIIFDEIGSHKLPSSYLSAFKSETNVFITPFGGKRRWVASMVRINFRNHRKIVVVDGGCAFIGGLNVGNEYLGKGVLGAWRDTFVRLDGPCVSTVQLAFLEDWHWATEELLELPTSIEEQVEDKSILILPSGPADIIEAWRASIIALANAAESRLWISSPYFVPGEGVLSSLQAAALRGVDVRILLPNKADHLLVYGSSYTFYPETLPVGIKIFRYTQGFLHEKVMLIDHDMAVIGTANLDNRSMRLNFEISALICNQETAQEVEKMFLADFAQARLVYLSEYTARSWIFRLGCRVARLLAPIQ